jgi:hypothetical protein
VTSGVLSPASCTTAAPPGKVLRDARARLLLVGVFCSVPELERSEGSRADGRGEGRPAGLARRSSELCHRHGLDYDVRIRTGRQTAAESVDAIIDALHAATAAGYSGNFTHPWGSRWVESRRGVHADAAADGRIFSHTDRDSGT